MNARRHRGFLAGDRGSWTIAWVAASSLAAAFFGGVALAQRGGRPIPTAAEGGSLWTQATPLDDGRQMLLVVDPQARALAIYHVDPAAGTLALKSSRDIRWDLMVEDFNGQEPRPSALRKMLEMPK